MTHALFYPYTSALVALSGGVDSAVLLYLAKEAGLLVHAATIASAFTPRAEILQAASFARQLDVPWHQVTVDVFAVPALSLNPKNRCYLCKKLIMSELVTCSASLGLEAVFDGTHADDIAGGTAGRPGLAALEELGVVSPFARAGIGKTDILRLADEYAIPALPASACLATRIPFGEVLTEEKLRRVDEAERLLRSRGISGVLRVRLAGSDAVIEVESPMLQSAELYADSLKELGIDNISVREYVTGGAIWKKKML